MTGGALCAQEAAARRRRRSSERETEPERERERKNIPFGGCFDSDCYREDIYHGSNPPISGGWAAVVRVCVSARAGAAGDEESPKEEGEILDSWTRRIYCRPRRYTYVII